MSVESFAAALDQSGWTSSMEYLDRLLEPSDKTLLVYFNWAQSRANLLTTPGYVEETACTPALNDLNPSSGNCIQDETSPDFSLQAIAYEGFFESFAKLKLASPLMVFVGEYWETDPLTPRTAFPNLGASPRNKPAEGILKAWYARP